MSESTDLSALKARLEDVEARQAILDAEKNAIREEILKECASLCAKFRFTARELRLPSEVKPRSAVSGAAFAPKYKNPDGPETWSGRGGRKPVWFTEALARGIPEEAMRIKPGTVESITPA